MEYNLIYINKKLIKEINIIKIQIIQEIINILSQDYGFDIRN